MGEIGNGNVFADKQAGRAEVVRALYADEPLLMSYERAYIACRIVHIYIVKLCVSHLK